MPALVVGGHKVQGTLGITRELQRLAPRAGLFPEDPERRQAVEKAERFGHDELQPIARRVFRWAGAHDHAVRAWMAKDAAGDHPGQLQPAPDHQDRHPGRGPADAHNIELVYVPFNASWLNRIEAQFTGLRYFALHGTDHPFHKQQGRAIRRYIAWRNRNRNPHDRRLRRIVERASRETRLVPRDGSVRRGRGAPERGGTA